MTDGVPLRCTTILRPQPRRGSSGDTKAWLPRDAALMRGRAVAATGGSATAGSNRGFFAASSNLSWTGTGGSVEAIFECAATGGSAIATSLEATLEIAVLDARCDEFLQRGAVTCDSSPSESLHELAFNDRSTELGSH